MLSTSTNNPPPATLKGEPGVAASWPVKGSSVKHQML
jgi:hypothetical protein